MDYFNYAPTLYFQTNRPFTIPRPQYQDLIFSY